ncbi:hypothetical protein GZH49_06350 [Nocardia terpenica]|uniref:hypothetical protein n=1 Tax=Nocardia terpenica TaxID=455432 RepID=UPI002FE3749B
MMPILIEDIEELINHHSQWRSSSGLSTNLADYGTIQDYAAIIANFLVTHGVELGWKDGSKYSRTGHVRTYTGRETGARFAHCENCGWNQHSDDHAHIDSAAARHDCREHDGMSGGTRVEKVARGDLVMVERVDTIYPIDGSPYEETVVLIGVVLSVRHGGQVKTWSDCHGASHSRAYDPRGTRYHIVSKASIDVVGAMEFAASIPWPGYPEHKGKPFGSVDEAREALGPFYIHHP